MKKRNVNFKLFIILLIGLFIRIYYFVGLNWSDDVHYVYLANQVLEGKFIPSYMTSLRLAMIFPLAFFFKLFGYSQFSAVLYPFLCSIGNIILAYLIGKLIIDEKTGLIAALIMAFYPLDVNYATWIMPDVPLSFFHAFSIYLFLIGEKERNRNKMILAGFFSGVSYLLKYSGLLIWVFFFSYVFLKAILTRKFEILYLYLLLGFSLVVLLESVYYYFKTGDLLPQLHSGFEYFTQKERLKYEFNIDLTFYPKVMFNLDNNWHFMLDNRYTYFGFFYYLFAVSTIYLLLKRKSSIYIILLWFFSIFLYQQFGSMSYKEYIPMHRLDRHLTTLSLPSVLIVATFFNLLLNRKSSECVGLLLLAFLLLSFLSYIDTITTLQKDAVKDTHLIFEEIKKLPEKKVFSDSGTIGHLNFYFQFRRKDLYSLNYRSCDDLKDSYVIINATRGWIEFWLMLQTYPTCIFKRENWKLIATIVSDAKSYPYNLFDPQIFYVPN
jgi:hypothetical protein